MSISIKSQKMLWGRAAGRCSNPNCRIYLYEDETETDDPTLIGENCHIIGESSEGPRADVSVSIDQRNLYANLILLCRNHHRIIDTQEGKYTVEVLLNMKAEHEKWVREQLGFDAAKLRDDEQYAGIVDNWERLAHLDQWHAWSSHVLSGGQPQMQLKIDSDLYELRGWMLNRVLPNRYPDLERSFHNFRLVLQDFQNCFRSRAEEWRKTGVLMTTKFYKELNEWNEEKHSQLFKEYEFHVDLVQDLMLELTRAGNLICDLIRKNISHGYRLEMGRLVVQTGPTMDMSFHDIVVQYDGEERNSANPYPGIDAFLIQRQERDMHFGSGSQPQF